MTEFKKLISEELNTKAEYKKLIDAIAETQSDLSLVCFLGAGTSIAQGYEGWNNYVSDLIQYWKSHLSDLVGKSMAHNKVDSKDLIFLNWLNNSGYDNKRKVDIVHLLIKDYCEPEDGDKNDWQSKYYNHENDFEKYYFLQVNPLKEDNEIINEVINLSGLFITSNYDDQIEKALQKYFQKVPKVLDDIKQINGEKLPNKSIIHLHGKPDRPKVLLVSSSESYNELYLKNNDIQRKLQDQLKLQNSKVLLFIGSSLQEDEILNLFTFPDISLQRFALMKFESGLSLEQAELLKQYYSKVKKIEVLWYGRQFDDLPKFLRQVNLDVEQKLKVDNSFVSDVQIKNDLKNEDYEAFDQDITQAIKNKEDFVDACFEGNLNATSIAHLAHNKKFTESIENGTNYFSFWREVTDNFKFMRSDQDTLNELLRCIENMPAMNSYGAMHFVYKYSAALDSSKDRFDFLYKYADKFLSNYLFFEDLLTHEERVLWFLVNLPDKQRLGILQDSYREHPKYFRFSPLALRKLLSIMSKDKYAAIASFSNIIGSEGWKFLYDLLLQNKLRFKGSKTFPHYVYKNKLMQRLLINLALEGKFPGAFDFNLLKESIDFDDKLLGKETNTFVEKFLPRQGKRLSKNYYIDGWYISDSPAREVEDKPFFEVLPLSSNDDVSSLIANLENIIKQRHPKYSGLKITPDIAEDVNIDGQGRSLEKALNDGYTWDKLSQYNIEFLKQVVTHPNVYNSFKPYINRVLIKGLQLGYVDDSLIKLFLPFLSKKPSKILEYSNRELLEHLVDSRKSQKLIFSFILDNVKLADSDFHASGFRATGTWINLNEFMNSKAYEFAKLTDIFTRIVKSSATLAKLHL